MANLTKAINKNFLDQVLPTFGNPRTAIPVWDNGQKMFICNEMESLSGNRYYMGVRFCDRVAIVEHVGIYHNWTYLDGLDLYAFNGQRVELIQKKEYDKVYRKEEIVRQEAEQMIVDYLKGMHKAKRVIVAADELAQHAHELVEACYKSYLDSDYNTCLVKILPAIGR